VTWRGDLRREVEGLFCDAQDPVVREVREAWLSEVRSRGVFGHARRGRVEPTSTSRERRDWETVVLRLRRMRDAPRPIPRCAEADSFGCPECGARFASPQSVLIHSYRMHGA